jgi:FKBP-type peptidyl-prolyl cis-trans isomerase FkpA
MLALAASGITALAAETETLASGVIILHTAPGKGANPTAVDTVKVHYRGTLADGKEFDSSYKRNEPTVFPLSRVVPCWTQGIQKI